MHIILKLWYLFTICTHLRAVNIARDMMRQISDDVYPVMYT